MVSQEQQKERLAKVLSQLGFDERKVDGLLKAFKFPSTYGPIEISIDHWKMEEDFFVQLHFKMESPEDGYHLDRIRALLHKPVPLEAEIINDIHIRRLEMEMQSLDWTFDYRPLELESRSGDPAVQKLYMQYLRAIHNLVMLNADEPMGRAISNELKLRHLLGTPYEQRYLSDALRNGKSQSRSFYLDDGDGLSIQQMRNILEGRSVAWQFDFNGKKECEWLMLAGPNDVAEVKSYIFSAQKRYPDFDLVPVISSLPIVYDAPSDMGQYIHNIRNGDLQAVKLNNKGKAVTYYLEANPAERTVSLYNSNKIKVNLISVLEDLKSKKNSAGHYRKPGR